jgi:enterochelin esterase family protein
VPGSEISDTRDVPHGAVAEVTYKSKSLDRFRRMHVYTPPGYERGEGKYPVFYLLHGAFDCDDAWSTVGRAGFILDNLIAAGKAKPMIVVMPAGHTAPFRFGPGGGFERQMGDFERDFREDVRPYIEANYRLLDGRENRALAGLSMGGAQTLNLAAANLEDYGYLGVFSSGVFGIAGGGPGPAPQGPTWVERNKAVLENASARQGLKLVWFATGKQDFLLGTSQATVKMLRDHGFDVVYEETDGGHTWDKWRDYLAVFAPLLFQEQPAAK